jgi:esterase/lipase
MRCIILLHGAIGAADQLEPLARELTNAGFKTYTLNFSGHGQTPFQEQFGISQFANELRSFIEENKLEKPEVFGYSMGGYVALYLAAMQPELLGSIVTLGTKLDWSPAIAEKEIKMLDPKTIQEKVPKFAEALQNRHGENWQLLLQRTANMMLDLGSNNLLNKNTYAKIKNKVAIGLADNDNMVSIEETDNAASKIVGCLRFNLSNTKHPIETVNVTYLADLITKFCK